MEYERIGKVQTGMISPSKLRMKLIGPHHLKKKDGSNSNSTRTSPLKHDDAELMKNSLLASETNNLLEEVTSSSLEVPPLKPSSDAMVHQNNMGLVKVQHSQKADNGKSSTTIHPAKITDNENLDCDSSASSSSFEFHRERPVSNPATRFLLRPIPSKWNDAEKWIMNRQNIQAGYAKKNALQNQVNHFTTNMVKVAPDSGYCDHKLPKAKVTETERVNGPVVESFPGTKDSKEADGKSAVPGIRSVAMRDMGTEMTPTTSQGPSTPIGSVTPVLSPAPSMPSTPRRGATAAADNIAIENPRFPVENTEKLSEEELKLKTRKEIQALGVQLGKMNIAAWASHDEKDEKKSSPRDINKEERGRTEFQKRAASWEEAEKSRYTARYKREDIKIQAWESQQKAKLEAEMRRIEAKIEQMKAQAHARAVKKIAMLRQRTEEKLAAAEARKNREAARITAKGEYIRQTGRIPSSNYICCGLL